MASIIQNFVDMVGFIGDAALSFPTSILLVVIGAVLIIGSSLVMAYLGLGAALDLLTPDTLGRPPQQRG